MSNLKETFSTVNDSCTQHISELAAAQTQNTGVSQAAALTSIMSVAITRMRLRSGRCNNIRTWDCERKYTNMSPTLFSVL